MCPLFEIIFMLILNISDFNDIIAIQEIIPELDKWFTNNFEIMVKTYGDKSFADLCLFYKF